MQNFVTNNVFLDKKVKHNIKKKQKKHKTHAGDLNWTRDLSHSKRMRYLCTTDSSESNDSSQAI